MISVKKRVRDQVETHPRAAVEQIPAYTEVVVHNHLRTTVYLSVMDRVWLLTWDQLYHDGRQQQEDFND